MNSSLDAYKQRLSELLDDLKVNSVLHRRLEKMSEELLSLKDPGSRIFTRNTLQFKMYYSPAKGMMEWNVTSLTWLCCLELPGGVLFGGTFEVMKGSGGGRVQAEAQTRPPDNSCSSSEMPTASRPGGAGCNMAISHGFCVAFHLGVMISENFIKTMTLTRTFFWSRSSSLRKSYVGVLCMHLTLSSFNRDPYWSLQSLTLTLNRTHITLTLTVMRGF